jgi:hypothetical protein
MQTLCGDALAAQQATTDLDSLADLTRRTGGAH